MEDSTETSNQTEISEADSLVESKLSPDIEIDNAGFKRQIFNFNETKFSFRGKEELPLYPHLANNHITLLGESPLLVEPEKYQRYKDSILKASVEDSPEFFLATRTPIGILELVEKLGNTDPSIRQIKDEIEKGIYSEKTLYFLDQVIAADYIDQNTFIKKANPYGEALVILSLLGDIQAKKIISQKIDVMRKLDWERDQNFKLSQKEIIDRQEIYGKIEALDPSELVCVHTTRYKPVLDDTQEFIVSTTFDAAKRQPRNTVHTSLNHKVEDVNMGFDSWTDTENTLMSSFADMIDANGLPYCFNTVDTWWTRNPGEPLIFKNAILVCPGGNMKRLFELHGKEYLYKSNEFNLQDLISIITAKKSSDKLIQSLNTTFLNGLFNELQRPEYEISDFTGIKEHLLQYFHQENDVNIEESVYLLKDFINNAKKETVNLSKALKDILTKSKISTSLSEEKVIELTGSLCRIMTIFLKREVHNLAVRKLLVEKGYKIQSGGARAWGEQEKEMELPTLKTVVELDIKHSVPHSNTCEGILTFRDKDSLQEEVFTLFEQGDRQIILKRIRGQLDWEDPLFTNNLFPPLENEEESKIIDTIESGDGFQWVRYSPYFDDLMSGLDIKTRRVIIASGRLTA